ncbi:hypothetical protein BJ508DRAFT_362020 [Ascobolus immersus RN42]|uniref:SRP9 domain-containing protein n=1 Tax=Ascobolus immersus RN42 TaxID=1160509 RepID=A0A3N4I966_ASCIM|nr:hypothetical protein BJ508DRAFT_362020 [Ascobolus immersus RN42]
MLLTTTPQQFLEESLLLIRAHPATTKTTTTYASASTLPSAPHPQPTTNKVTKRKKRRVPTLTIKTYDPISGSVIVFKTDKIADVGRVVTSLARVARSMGGLPDVEDKEEEAFTPATAKEAAPTTPAATPAPAATASGKGKKKKGKK